MKRRKTRKLNKKELKVQRRLALENPVIEGEIKAEPEVVVTVSDKPKTVVEVPKIFTVREFSERLGLPVTQVITELIKNGVMASINESIDYETAILIGDELGFEIKLQSEQTQEKQIITEDEKALLKPRPPVVVVLGHVDHGKTTLLDNIRKADVVSTESGGITQHIGAYQVKLKTKNLPTGQAGSKLKAKAKEERLITFLDTPGHEAFSAMRAHGTNITDIAILVVAADDGVKPQTKEAVSHAKAANVPIVVAINKIDKPGADIEKVKRELADLDLVTEDWGGKTVMVPISAKLGKGIDELLDMVLITADLLELKANPTRSAQGVVIESFMQMGMGPLATVLIQNGTLRSGDTVVVGQTYGKIKRMEDYLGNVIVEAFPSTPVRIAGLKSVPDFGVNLEIVSDDKEAKIKIQNKILRQRHLGLAELSEKISSGQLQAINIILKADVQGSVEAIKNSLTSLNSNDITTKIIHEGVGDIYESDVNLAIASNAVIIGFKVKVTPSTKNLAKLKGVKISLYDIIYNLLDDVKAALAGLLKPEIIEVNVGKFEVIKVFNLGKNQQVLGGKVFDGKIQKGNKVHYLHSQEKIANSKISSLQIERNPVNEVEKGFECGITLDPAINGKPGDILEAYELEEVTKVIHTNG